MRRYRANSSLLGNLFAKRLNAGTMIDRGNQKKRKNPKHVALPDTLAKFFKKYEGPNVARESRG